MTPHQSSPKRRQSLVLVGIVSFVFAIASGAQAQVPTFSSSTLSAPAATGAYAVATGDFDGNGKPDLAVANYSAGTVTVWLGNGAGSFTQASGSPLTSGTNPASLAVADINGDGKLDLVAADAGDVTNNIAVWLGNGDGTFQAVQFFSAGLGPVSIAVGDFNGDGEPDLAIANSGGTNVTVLVNTTASTATTVAFAAPANFPAGLIPQSVAIGDFNGDGKQDLAIANNILLGTVTVLLGNGSGSFSAASYSPIAVGASLYSVAVGDFNKDGIADLALASSGSDQVIVLQGSGSGFTQFTGSPYSTGHLPYSVTLSDFDGDGNLDLATANGAGNVTVLLGNGSGAFTAASGSPFGAGSIPQFIAAADFNLDGEPDLAIANSGGGNVTLLLNSSPALTANPVSLTFYSELAGQSSLAAATITAGGTGYAVNDIVTMPDGAPHAQFKVTAVNGTGGVTAIAPVSVGGGYSVGDVQGLQGGSGSGLTVSVTAVGEAGSVASPASISVTVNSSVSGSTYTSSSNQSWATPSPASNGTGAPTTVTLSANQGTLPAGTQKAKVRFASPNFFGGKTAAVLNVAAPTGTVVAAAASPFAAGTHPVSMAEGDFNGDGKPDLVVVNFLGSGTVTVLLGDGNGGFNAPGNSFAAGPSPKSVAVGDFNGDGKLDLVVVDNQTNGTVTLLLGDGAGNFTPAFGSPFATGSLPQSVAVGDFNGDGKLDLAVANFSSGNLTILLGNGMGGFGPAPGSEPAVPNPIFLATGDFNGDGKPDLAVARNDGFVSVLLGDGTGGFNPALNSPFAVGNGSESLAVADLNADGKSDLAVTNRSDSTVSVLLGDGTGNFTPAPHSPFFVNNSYGVAVGDINGDGKPDLAVTTANNPVGRVAVLLGDGTGNFTAATGSPFLAGAAPLAVLVGDFNGDGKSDLAVANEFGNSVALLLGNLATDNLTLAASPGASVPYGTSVTLTATLGQTGFNAPSGSVSFQQNGVGISTASNSPFTSVVSNLAIGSYSFVATYSGDARNLNVSSSSLTVTVTQASQTITFGPLSNVNLGVAPFAISATSTSPQPIQFTSNSTGVCAVAGTTVTILATGQCSISANQAANANYTAAPTVTQTFIVTLAATASFVTLDTTTQGTWKGIYGADGEAINGDSTNYPSYAQVNLSGLNPFIWNPSTADVRALQKFAAPDRIASGWYTFSNMTVDLNLTDGNTHQMALYALDFDTTSRAERIDVLDAVSGTVLDTRTISSFSSGEYLVWNLKGHVTLKITLTGGDNAVISGLLFGGAGSTAAFVKTDTATQGNWKEVYGADGEAINGNNTSYPAYAQVNLSGLNPFTWNPSTTDVRALEKFAASDRIASGWYTSSNMSVDVNLTDGNTHQVALYALDFDTTSRAERIDVLDAVSGALLDRRTISSFSSGEYLAWNLKGHVTLKITLTGGANAVISGLFFGGASATAAAFVATDSITQGTWKGVYGTDGEAINDDSTNYPAYAQVTLSGLNPFIWNPSTTDPRALEKAAASDRIASGWYTFSNMSVDVNLTDGNTHQVELYALDFDTTSRAERIDVLDAVSGVLLDTRTISSFSNGEYLIWNLKGHVTLKITLTGGPNAVISGLLFGGTSATAAFVKIDTATQGTWKGVYGADGEAISGDSTNYPAYAQVILSGLNPFTWNPSTTDVRALEKFAASGRIASGWYTSSNMSVDVNLTDGNVHQVTLYALDFDTTSRAERIDVLDAVSGALLDTRTISNFSGGQYLAWNLTGHVTLKITLTGGANAVISGLFFGGASATAAAFVGTDATTQGTWKGVYGTDGEAINGDSTNYPAYAQVTLSGLNPFIWNPSTTDPRALEKAAASDRIASGWYTFSNMSVDVNLTDGNTHQVELYALDFDTTSRAERIDVLDAVSGVLLDTRTISSFSNGEYLIWNLKGHVTLKITLTGGANAVISGLFFH